jgi:hypothetical protein
MNLKQKVILFFGIIVFVAMGIYPPWVLGFGSRTVAGSYTFIINPPDNAKFIDLYRLCVQWCMVAVSTGCFIIILKDKKKD